MVGGHSSCGEEGLDGEASFHDLPNPIEVNFKIADSLFSKEWGGFLRDRIPSGVGFPEGIMKVSEISLKIVTSGFLKMLFQGAKSGNESGESGDSSLRSIPWTNTV